MEYILSNLRAIGFLSQPPDQTNVANAGFYEWQHLYGYHFKSMARSKSASTRRMVCCLSCCFNRIATDSGSSPWTFCASLCSARTSRSNASTSLTKSTLKRISSSSSGGLSGPWCWWKLANSSENTSLSHMTRLAIWKTTVPETLRTPIYSFLAWVKKKRTIKYQKQNITLGYQKQNYY